MKLSDFRGANIFITCILLLDIEKAVVLWYI